MRQKNHLEQNNTFTQNDQAPEVKTSPWFHARPVAVAALGLLFGLLIGDGFSLSRAMIAALVLLVCALAARILKKAMWTVFLVCMAVGFVRVALAVPTQVPTGTGIVQGRICETPEAREDGSYRVYLADATLSGTPVSGRLRLFARLRKHLPTVRSFHSTQVSLPPPKNIASMTAIETCSPSRSRAVMWMCFGNPRRMRTARC